MRVCECASYVRACACEGLGFERRKACRQKLGRRNVRLGAAGRVRSAVALELVARKVWALPVAVQLFCSCDPLPQLHGSP